MDGSCTISTVPTKRISFSKSSSGNNTLVSAVAAAAPEPAKAIRVVCFGFICDSAVTVQFCDGAGTGTPLTGAMSFPANGGMCPPYNPAGHFQTSAGTLLNLSLGGAVGVNGWLDYQEV